MLAPIAGCLTRGSAQRLVRLQLDAATRRKIQTLAGKANAGLLTDAEKSEYFDYVEGMDLIGILQAKARKVLARQAAA